MGNQAGNCYNGGANDNYTEIQSKMYQPKVKVPIKRKFAVIPVEEINEMEGKMIKKTLRSGRIVTGINRKNKIPEGEIKYPNGDIYNGRILEGMANGEGNMVYKSGGNYTGFLVRDKKEGYGVLKMANGNIYRGEFKNDQFEGKGTVQYESGDIFEGISLNSEKMLI